MTKHIDEQLSAFVDGELAEKEANLLIKEILDSDELRSRWANYHLVGHSIHGESTNNTVDLSKGISAALADEPTVFAPQRRKRVIPAAFKQVAGMAIAATVAAAAVLMVQPEEQNLFNPSGVGSVASSSTVKQDIVPVAEHGVNWSVSQPSVASKLNTYLVNHNAYSTPVRGTLPFAPIVSYGNKHSAVDAPVMLEYNSTGSSVRR